MNVALRWVTPNAEFEMAYEARGSNAKNQDNPEYAKLFHYLIKHKHWSPFEMANMCVEIVTSRAIAAQILRHRSFSFQEFSQRYATAEAFEPIEVRRQASKNRQSSLEVFNPTFEDGPDDYTAQDQIDATIEYCNYAYQRLLEAGVAREVARMVLPLSTQTKLYMNGTVRSWIHYLSLRAQEDAQKEHRDVANAIKSIFVVQFPTLKEALEW